jgi:Protein of unknown function (DUF4232)
MGLMGKEWPVTTLAYRRAQAAALRWALPLASGLTAALLATGCGTVASPSGSAAQSPESPSAAGSTGPASQPAAATLSPCAVSDLTVTIGQGNGAAGSIYYPLDFTNTSGAACTMYGYPGVAFVTRSGATASAGSILGAPAVRNPAFTAKLVTLASGATAHASLQVQMARSYPAATCKPVTGHWLRVYPPGSYAALYVRFTAVTCAGKITSGSTLGIYVVRPGAAGP